MAAVGNQTDHAVTGTGQGTGRREGSAPPRPTPIYDSGAFRIPLLAELHDLLRYRFLVWNLIARDLKVRYKRSVIGFIWVMLNPLLTMAVLTLVFANIFKWNIHHFSIYLLAGILSWGLYSQGSVAAMGALQSGGPMLRKLFIPPSVFVTSAVGSALVNLLFATGPFLVLAFLSGVRPSVTWSFIAVPILLMTLFTLGVAYIVSALFVFFRDTFEIYQVLVNAYYFVTPIFYPLSILPQPLRGLVQQFNPMYLTIDMLRTAVIGGAIPPLNEMLTAAGWALGALVVGWTIFTRMEGNFVYNV
jgi:ABC-type polysaccharide/polyol phosphate export permease